MSGALDGPRQHALVPSAGAGLATGADFSIVGNETPEHVGFLIIDADALVGAELTGLGPREVSALPWS